VCKASLVHTTERDHSRGQAKQGLVIGGMNVIHTLARGMRGEHCFEECGLFRQGKAWLLTAAWCTSSLLSQAMTLAMHVGDERMGLAFYTVNEQ
jgi:hypothetical protein